MTVKKPNVNSAAEMELEKAQKQFDSFDQEVKSLTMDRMNETPKSDIEPQTKMAQSDIADSKDVYLKPIKFVADRMSFNEKFREKWNFAKEFVYFIAENKEIIGEHIEMWTKPFRGVPAEFWQVPVNTPIWAPRYVAEQIKRKYYHKLEMKEQTTNQDGMGQYYGKIVVQKTEPRLDAYPATKKRSFFMGSF